MCIGSTGGGGGGGVGGGWFWRISQKAQSWNPGIEELCVVCVCVRETKRGAICGSFRNRV